MPRKLIKRLMPDPQKIREQKCLRFLGTCLHNPSLWHLNRQSVAGAFFVGMVCAFIPIPFQMVLAGALAVVFHVNIPISVALVWLTNPLTMPPLFYFAYEVGQFILGQPDVDDFVFEPSLEWMLNLLQHNWQPFILGCLVTGISLGLIGYVAIHVIWRRKVTARWRRRPWRLALAKQRADKGASANTSTSFGTPLLPASAGNSGASNPRTSTAPTGGSGTCPGSNSSPDSVQL